jgi:hypothetical protein
MSGGRGGNRSAAAVCRCAPAFLQARAAPRRQLVRVLLGDAPGAAWERYLEELQRELGADFRSFLAEVVWASGTDLRACGAVQIAGEAASEGETTKEDTVDLYAGRNRGRGASIFAGEGDGGDGGSSAELEGQNRALREQIDGRDEELTRLHERLWAVAGRPPPPRGAAAAAATRTSSRWWRPCDSGGSGSGAAVSASPEPGTPPGGRGQAAQPGSVHPQDGMYVREMARKQALEQRLEHARQHQLAEEEAALRPEGAAAQPLPHWYRDRPGRVDLRPCSRWHEQVSTQPRAGSAGSQVRSGCHYGGAVLAIAQCLSA